MPFPRKRIALQFSEEERRKLDSIRVSRVEEKRRTLRAAILLDSWSGQSDDAIAKHHHVSRSTVVLCIAKCLQFGLDSALGELPRTGKPRQVPDDVFHHHHGAIDHHAEIERAKRKQICRYVPRLQENRCEQQGEGYSQGDN